MSRITRLHGRWIAVAFAAAVLVACSPPTPPEEDRRPEPQASDAPAPGAPPQSAIVQAADAYKDRARSAAARQTEAADQQRAQLDAATQ